ncbi:hypothetical protein LIER_03741 [Lithospermum erythrorhizon]|uniref:CCHC-type domain-containing protein n=1 Tax=Lithospermum erythrorhizon TaxID=34254 RepID=A0AAV3NV05_LITER
MNKNRWKKTVKQDNYGKCQSNKPKGIQCRECEDFGHIQSECPNYLKKQSKNYSSTMSDDESEDGQDDQVNNFVAFTGVLEPIVTDIVDDNSED